MNLTYLVLATLLMVGAIDTKDEPSLSMMCRIIGAVSFVIALLT